MDHGTCRGGEIWSLFSSFSARSLPRFDNYARHLATIGEQKLQQALNTVSCLNRQAKRRRQAQKRVFAWWFDWGKQFTQLSR